MNRSSSTSRNRYYPSRLVSFRAFGPTPVKSRELKPYAEPVSPEELKTGGLKPAWTVALRDGQVYVPGRPGFKMEIPVQRHPLVNLLAKIIMGAWLGGASLLTPAVAGGMDQEPAPPTASNPKAEDSGQTCPGTKQGHAAGESNPSPEEGGQRHSLYRSWRRMTEQAEGSQPDWLSPLATTSGRIKDEFRYDMWRQSTPTGSTISTFGGDKGLEFIAAPYMQVLLGVPSYRDHSAASPSDGFGDLPLMLKFRIASANKSEGNYLVTFLLSVTAPTASRPNGTGDAVLTPTLALGKGWGRFDVQSTFGANLPEADTQRLGRQLLWNTTFQYRAGWKLWPEMEVNSTFFQEGESAGDKQTFLTPGLGFGRLRLYRGLRFSMAGGLQIAVTRFHTYDHRWMLSVRFPF